MVSKLLNFLLVCHVTCMHVWCFPTVSEVFAEVGELRNVPPFITLTISCDQLISTLVPLNVTLNITWTKDERTAENGSAPNLIITQDRHQLILAPTKLKDGGQLGNSGTYACTVCSDNETCIKSQSHCEICSKFVCT